MPINKIQFQHGMSWPDFLGRYGNEEQCIQALFACRWPTGFSCPRCTGSGFYRIQTVGRPLFQCRTCRHQASLTAGTLLESSKLPLRIWFLAIYIISQAKTGISSLALKRQLGVDYRTAWLMHHKLLHAMSEADSQHSLKGDVLLDDAYLGGEKPGTPGRGSPNKVPIVAAVSLNEAGRPVYMKVTAISGFTTDAIKSWAKASLMPGCDVRSDGLACFAGVIDAGCAHSFVVVGQRKPRDLPQFTWVNTVLGNLKTKINGAHKHFNFAKYANRYLGAFAYRFNRRFELTQLVHGLIRRVTKTGPLTEKAVRRGAEVHH
jgi:transposase-like protein